MAIDPIGNMVHINQNMNINSQKQADFQSKLDLQASMSIELLKQKDSQIEETRPTEEAYKIDPQREHERKKNRQEPNAHEEQTLQKEGEKEELNQNDSQNFHMLDILA